MSSILRSSKFVRYFFGLARSLVISNRQEFDGGILQRTHHLAGLFSNNFSSSPLNLQSGSFLEKTVRQLDEDARRTGRVSITEIEEALNSIKNTRTATATQSLMVIRCCGNLIPEESPEHRTKLVEEIWKTFEKLGVPLDISHYNALLKVYLENEHRFSPTEFLARLEQNGIVPNRVTYQRLIAGFCQQGDIEGATKILEFMKEKQIPVSEGVFNALILGHSKADDMESAEAILNMMRQANLEPSNETYTMLLSGYAGRGDAEALQRLLTECKVKDVLLSDRDFLEIGYNAAINGHDQLLDEILKNIRHSMGYNQDAANMILRLVTSGKDEAAYKVFLSMNPHLRTNTFPNMSGHLFIKHIVKSSRPVDQILSWCERLQKDGHTSLGLWIAVDTSFSFSNTDLTLDLLRTLKQKQEPVRPHYFWPSLVTAGKASDFNRMNDILKKMISEFEVPVSSETLRDYFLPYVPSPQSTTEILKSLDALGVKRGQAVVGIICHLLNKNNAKEATELAFQYPGLNLRGNLTTRNLIDVLESTDDVHSIVGLLHVFSSPRTSGLREDKDEEEEVGSSEEVVTRFLINLVSYAPTRKYVADVLKEMVERGLAINSVCAEIVENKLQGKELTSEVSSLLAKLSSGAVEYQPIKRIPSAVPTARSAETVERIKEKIKANDEPAERIISTNRSLYQIYCQEGDVENALRIKKELEEELKQEVTPGMWAGLLDAYCVKNDLEGAKNCLEKIKASGSEFELDPQKILKMAKLYIENNQFDEAITLVKSVKPRHKVDGGTFAIRSHSWQTLQATAETYKDPELVKKVLNTLVELKYVDFSNAMLGPIVKAHLLRDDLEGALKEFEECVRLHRATPYKNELTMRLIEKEDATNLQTLVDLSTQVHGEVNSLYDLVLNFIECGRVRQARKILETPGLTSRNNRLLLACERYKKEGKSDYLEGLIEVTKDLGYIDRAEIYSSLLDTYCQADQVEKALGLWTKMQDEDVNITDEFLIKLGNFLKMKGHQVPFKIPNKVSESVGAPVKQEKIQKPIEPKSPLLVAIGKNDVDEALRLRDELENSGKKLSRSETNRLLELLVEQSRLRDAASLVTSLTEEQLPAVRVLNFLITRLAAKGETELLHRVAEHLPENLKRLTSITNRHMSAAVAAGTAKVELDRLEEEIDTASSPEDIDNVASKFPRGGIMAVLESSPTHYEQVIRIVDKYHKKGSSLPANCLVMFHLGKEEVEKAHQLYQQYNLHNSSRLMFRNVLNRARETKNPKLLEELLTLTQGAPSVTPEVKGLIYSNLIDVYSIQEDYDSGLRKLEEGLQTVPLELFHNTALTKLKNGLEASNKTFKYTIPPKRKARESSSSSSSSSETEPKKSVASN